MKPFPQIETTPLVCDLLAQKAPIAIGVSGGKDSTVVAYETQSYLQSIGHQGPVLLIHSDLGRVEHTDSLPTCERLAHRLGLDLVVVRRQKGDMMDRWLQRWQDNLERYQKLLCVKLILPWSTATWRFCTSELKTAIMCRDLVERYPKQTILSVSGIRRMESATRAKAPICAPQAKLRMEKFHTQGYSWNPLLAWTTDDVFRFHREQGIPLHEAYTRFGMSRVSCAYCILASLSDLVGAATDPRNHDIYREMVDLEIVSSFSFQSERWLGDVAPHLLSGEQIVGLKASKERATQREQTERRIPPHLLYQKEWPCCLPTPQEAALLSEVRRNVAEIMGIGIAYSEADAIVERYAELLALKALREKGRKQPPLETTPMQELWEGQVY